MVQTVSRRVGAVWIVLASCSGSETSAESSDSVEGGSGVAADPDGPQSTSRQPDAGESPGASGDANARGTRDASVEDATGSPPSGPIDCRSDGDATTTLVFVNRCDDPVTFRGSDIAGGVIDPGAHECVDIGSDVEPLSSKRYWGWIGSDPGGEHHTLAEFTFNTDFNDFDWYNISHVDAHNLPMQIIPVARPDCATLTCAESFLTDCPDDGLFTDTSGNVVACVSPDRDNPQSPVALFFESCDDAYAWSGDDQAGSDPSPVRACAGEDWDIVFCPGGAS